MATVTLHGASSYHYAGMVFRKGDPAVVDDKVARDLENFTEYFDIVLDGVKSPKPGGAAKIKPRAAVSEPQAVEI